MRLAQIEIHNIKGFSDLSLEIGDVNVAAGENGWGKTSFIAAVTGLLGKASPRILRTGSEEGRLRAVLAGEDETWEVARVFRPGEVRTPEVRPIRNGKPGRAIAAPASFLKQIVDELSAIPINELMQASEERQREVILETVPMELAAGELEAAATGAGVPPSIMMAARKKGAVESIASVRKYVYDQRTDVNRDARTKRIHAQELRGSLMPDIETTDWGAEAARLTQLLQQAVTDEMKNSGEAHDSFLQVKQSAQLSFLERAATIDRDIDEKIRHLNEQRSQRKAAMVEETDQRVSEAQVIKDRSVSQIAERWRPIREKLRADLAIAQQNSEQVVRARQTLQIAARAEGDAAACEAQADTMTAALDSLDSLKDGLLKKIPIKGLAFSDDGAPLLNGVPLSEVNTEQRGKFWIQIVARRAKGLGIVCMDGCECFDPKNFAAIVEAAKQTGLQWFLGRVDGQPFRIERIDAEALEAAQ
jgi:hypothetical protein